MENYVLYIFIFCFGLIIGSFVNVLIYRIPKGISVVFPRSACPHCKKKILWYENIPVFSYLFLKGRCRKCHRPISACYPIIELISGITAVMLFPKEFNFFELQNFIFLYSVFVVFCAHFVIDLRHQILPDGLNLYLALICFYVSFWQHDVLHMLLGAAIGVGFPLFVTWGFYKIRGQIGLGGGDIKLYGAMGIYLGPYLILQNIFLSCLLGSFVGLILIALKKMDKDRPMAFGPYILITSFSLLLYPNWFDQLLGF